MATIYSNNETININPTDDLVLYKEEFVNSRIEKFLYAICALDFDDLPTPLSRIEELYKCLATGLPAPTFVPQSRVEKYLMAILGAYYAGDLPAPQSRTEVLLNKILMGDTDLSDIEWLKSRYEFLLAYIAKGGKISSGSGDDFEYLQYIFSSSMYSIDRTKEVPVKSAILKGQTLVNHFDLLKWGEQEKITLVADGTAKTIYLGKPSTVKADTKYLTIIPIYENTINNNLGIGGWNYYGSQPIIRIADGTGIIKKIETTRNTDDRFHDGLYMELWAENTSGQITFGKPMLIEYQEGMENWDIPYFEGMQSVKMPVLTTTGKNLFNEGQTPEQLSWGSNIRRVNIKENTIYTYSSSPYTGHVSIKYYDNNDNEIKPGTSIPSGTSFTTPLNTSYMKTHTDPNSLVQIEEGSVATEYEPYKSTAVSCNEEVELRGIGEVKDELDLLTGELTRRIDESGNILSQEITESIDISTVDQDENNTKLRSFEDITHVTVTSDGILPDVELSVAKYHSYLTFLLESISNDTLYNTKEVPVKSAVLKGNTLINCIIDSSRNGYGVLASSITIEDEGWLTAVASSNNIHFELPMGNLIIKPATKYLLVIECESNSYQESDTLHHNLNMANTYSAEVDSPWVENLEIKMLPVGISTYILTTKSDFSILNNPVGCRSYMGVGTGTTKFRYMIIEYQEGMENWDIPYFEGMQSVKMPVLTTTGKNLFDVNKFESIGIDEHGYYVPTKFVDSIAYVTLKLKPNTRYTVTGEYISDGNAAFVYRIENNGTYRNLNTDFDTDATGVVNIRIGSNNYDVSNAKKVKKIMIVESTLKNIYEPFKSNILTTSEDVVLSRIGDVRDELNLLTGELNQRIGKIVLDGSSDEDWYITNGGSDTHTRFVMRRGSNLKPIYYVDQEAFLCSKFKCVMSISGTNSDEMCLMEAYDNFFVSIIIDNTKLNSVDVDGFKLWLQSNPVKINYVIEDESIKTVDLMTVDQDGNEISKIKTFDDITHVCVSSEGLIPEAELEVATKNEEVLNTMSLKMDDIYAIQTTLEETSNAQSENVDATMIATTEIYEGLL